jgi:hypothetical protein
LAHSKTFDAKRDLVHRSDELWFATYSQRLVSVDCPWVKIPAPRGLMHRKRVGIVMFDDIEVLDCRAVR